MADIELVVKIPEEIYKASQIIDVKYEDVIQIPLEVIAHGIPLPKGHGRLIDEKEVKKMIEEAKVNSEHSKTFAENIIKFAPTIIEADKEQEDGNDD